MRKELLDGHIEQFFGNQFSERIADLPVALEPDSGSNYLGISHYGASCLRGRWRGPKDMLM